MAAVPSNSDATGPGHARLDEARRRGIAPFIILHDRTLQQIAAARPQTTDALLDVAGIGPAKAAEYGDAIVSVVSAHSLP